jgi:hypothetical protein
MKRRPLVLLSIVAVLASVLAYSFAAEAKPSGGNNKLNAQACQGTGYLSLYRTNGTGFSSADECASYAAMGGILSWSPPPDPAADEHAHQHAESDEYAASAVPCLCGAEQRRL